MQHHAALAHTRALRAIPIMPYSGHLHVLRALVGAVHSDAVWMVDALHDVNLAHRKFDLVLAIGPDFWQDFHGGLMSGSFPDE